MYDSTLSVPRPYQGTWRSAGAVILGDEFSLAWRVLNAQYWGVPQRRRRIFLVADFGGTTAPQILFKQDSLFRNSKESQRSWQGITTTTETSIDDTSRADIKENGVDIEKDMQAFHINQREEIIDNHNIAGTLMATRTMQMQTFVQEPFYALCDQGGQRMDVYDNKVGTLRASMAGNLPIVLANPKLELFDNHARDCRYDGPLEIAPTITTTYGTGGGNIPLLSKPIVKQESYCIASNIINREDHNGGNGKGFQSDLAYTLTTSDIHAIYSPKPYQKVVGALMHRDHKGVNTCYVNQNKCIVEPQVFGQASYGGYDDNISTLTASGGTNGGGSENLALTRNLVRRLTPLECERLQGFPDGWTNIKGASDSPRYKALGNSVAIPCVDFVMAGIAYFLEKENVEV